MEPKVQVIFQLIDQFLNPCLLVLHLLIRSNFTSVSSLFQKGDRFGLLVLIREEMRIVKRNLIVAGIILFIISNDRINAWFIFLPIYLHIFPNCFSFRMLSSRFI